MNRLQNFTQNELEILDYSLHALHIRLHEIDPTGLDTCLAEYPDIWTEIRRELSKRKYQK